MRCTRFTEPHCDRREAISRVWDNFKDRSDGAWYNILTHSGTKFSIMQMPNFEGHPRALLDTTAISDLKRIYNILPWVYYRNRPRLDSFGGLPNRASVSAQLPKTVVCTKYVLFEEMFKGSNNLQITWLCLKGWDLPTLYTIYESWINDIARWHVAIIAITETERC